MQHFNGIKAISVDDHKDYHDIFISHLKEQCMAKKSAAKKSTKCMGVEEKRNMKTNQ